MEMYTEFKRFFGNRSLTMDLLHFIEDSKLEDELVAFYPKNWLTNGETPELVLFTKTDIVRVAKNHKILEVEIHKNFEVKKLSYLEHLNNRYAGSKLEIFLLSGDHIFFDASNDTNEDFVEYSNKYLKEIYNYLK